MSGILPENVYSQEMTKDDVMYDYEGHYKKNEVEIAITRLRKSDLHNTKKPFFEGKVEYLPANVWTSCF